MKCFIFNLIVQTFNISEFLVTRRHITTVPQLLLYFSLFLLFIVGLHLGTSSKKTVAICENLPRCLEKPINSDHADDESSVIVSCAPGSFCLNSHVDDTEDQLYSVGGGGQGSCCVCKTPVELVEEMRSLICLGMTVFFPLLHFPEVDRMSVI